jgi:hypothetical protein
MDVGLKNIFFIMAAWSKTLDVIIHKQNISFHQMHQKKAFKLKYLYKKYIA